jgi:hypothetical protein
MHNKDTVLIVYPPGGYGFFLNWCLEYFSGNLSSDATLPTSKTVQQQISTQITPVTLPNGEIFFITSNGTHQRCNVADYASNKVEYQFGRTTAFFSNDQARAQHKSYIQDYQSFFKKFVCLTQDQRCYLMMTQNFLNKHSRMQNFIERTISINKDIFSAQLPVPHWQLREMISFEHNTMLRLHTEFYQPISHNKVINVAVTDLADNFQTTLIELFENLKLPMLHQDQLGRIETEWMAGESFTKIDRLCHDIVAAVLDGHNMSWQPEQLTLIDEAYVQCLLRNKNFEIRCHNLNSFPTNSAHLKQLLCSV